VFANPVIHAGGSVFVVRQFDAGQCLRLLADRAMGITHVFGVPANFQFMAQHPDFPATDFPESLTAVVGGAPAPSALLESWNSKGVLMQQVYGMTETGPAALMLDAEDAVRKIGAAGKPVLHVEVRLAGPGMSDVPAGETGEILLKGPGVTPGYWQQPTLTAATFTEGWLHTGDAATIDPEGFYYIVDRWKDMFISGGENVYPAEVENVLHLMPAVAETAVIGVPSARWGEVGRAIVVRKAGHSLTEEEIISHCARHLARFKLPQSIVFIDALPRNATGKIHKPTLRTQFGTAQS
jgi:fatty-acyl-CoA synthase